MDPLNRPRAAFFYRTLALSLTLFVSACSGGGGSSSPEPTSPEQTASDATIDSGNGGTGTASSTTWITTKQGISSGINAVAWTGTQYLGVSDSGEVVTSSDGENWNLGVANDTAGSNSVIWANNLFVSTGGFASIRTSSDGVNWTSRNGYCSCTDELFAVTWAESISLFAAVGEGGRIYTSPDGLTWTEQTSGASSDTTFRAAASSGSRIVVVGNSFGGTSLLYSDDGVSWSPASFDVAPDGLSDVMWAGSQFVAVGFGGVYTSADGVSWQRKSTTGVFEIAWDGSRYIGATGVGGISTSTDLVTWTSVFYYPSHSINDLVYAPQLGQFLAVGEFSVGDWGLAITSTDTTTWNIRVGSDQIAGITWDGSRYTAVDQSGRLFVSSDGNIWDSTAWVQQDYSSEVFGDIEYATGLGRYVAVSSNKISSSEDGVNWTERYSDTFLAANSVLWTGAKFVTVGWNGNFLTSSDGVAWNRIGISGVVTPTPHLEGIAWSDSLSMYAAVSLGGDVYTSTNEVDWTEHADVSNDILYGITWTGSRFVAVGNAGTIITSADGANWTDHSITSGPYFRDVTASAGEVIAVGSGGRVFVSTDHGDTWSEQSTDTTDDLYGVLATPNKFLVGGEAGTVLTRP